MQSGNVITCRPCAQMISLELRKLAQMPQKKAEAAKPFLPRKPNVGGRFHWFFHHCTASTSSAFPLSFTRYLGSSIFKIPIAHC